MFAMLFALLLEATGSVSVMGAAIGAGLAAIFNIFF